MWFDEHSDKTDCLDYFSFPLFLYSYVFLSLFEFSAIKFSLCNDSFNNYLCKPYLVAGYACVCMLDCCRNSSEWDDERNDRKRVRRGEWVRLWNLFILLVFSNAIKDRPIN